jgi:hypothetical protein
VEPDAGLPPGEARRLKLLFALLLCPACFGAFLLATLGTMLAGAGAFLLGNAWWLAGTLAATAGLAAGLVLLQRRRGPACPADACAP